MDEYAAVRVCKWFQCSMRFDSLDDLRDHVVQAHVRTAQPLPRRDVALYRRIEEGMVRSLSLNDPETYESNPHALKRRRVEKEDLEPWQYVNPADTLPSPTSERLEYPDEDEQDIEDAVMEEGRASPERQELSYPSEGERSPSPPPAAPAVPPNINLLVPPRRTFASLSSPTSSQGSISPFPNSPSIEEQIARHREKKAAKNLPTSMEARHSTASQSSSSSREAVETQLTATLDWDAQSDSMSIQQRQPSQSESVQQESQTLDSQHTTKPSQAFDATQMQDAYAHELAWSQAPAPDDPASASATQTTGTEAPETQGSLPDTQEQLAYPPDEPSTSQPIAQSLSVSPTHTSSPMSANASSVQYSFVTPSQSWYHIPRKRKVSGKRKRQSIDDRSRSGSMPQEESEESNKPAPTSPSALSSKLTGGGASVQNSTPSLPQKTPASATAPPPVPEPSQFRDKTIASAKAPPRDLLSKVLTSSQSPATPQKARTSRPPSVRSSTPKRFTPRPSTPRDEQSLPPLPSSDEDDSPPPLPRPPRRDPAHQPPRPISISPSPSPRTSLSPPPSRHIASPPPCQSTVARASDNKFVSCAMSIFPDGDPYVSTHAPAASEAPHYTIVDDDDPERYIGGEDPDEYEEEYEEDGGAEREQDDSYGDEEEEGDSFERQGGSIEDYIDVDALEELSYPDSYPPLQTQAPYQSQSQSYSQYY
ncbi:uncharacterized protein SCHCODRAFT_02687474 [Schizophyllum commune H4-8]|nr:uncharacterized protein SCHCODRAFT_02687474 [Schizophyllum commune H4-8]KAI5893394.1 hypothetical protein SCHCODRAFT_02687474 [Schizophyllum commune H4-8]